MICLHCGVDTQGLGVVAKNLRIREHLLFTSSSVCNPVEVVDRNQLGTLICHVVRSHFLNFNNSYRAKWDLEINLRIARSLTMDKESDTYTVMACNLDKVVV